MYESQGRAGAPASSAGYLPQGWPVGVAPPGVADWELSASAYLFEWCPSDYRGLLVLRRHPVVLARFAASCVEAQAQAHSANLAGARAALAGLVGPSAIEEAVEALLELRAGLARAREGVGLIDEALRGAVFVPRM